MPGSNPIGGPKLSTTQAVGALAQTPGYQDLAKLGQQALDALVAGGNAGDQAKARELLGAIQIIASQVAAPAAPALDKSSPASILAYIAGGGTDCHLNDEQAKALTSFVEQSIAGGTNLATIAAAAKNMSYGVPSREAPEFLAHVAGNFGPGLQHMIVDGFRDAGHDLDKFGLSDISFGPMAM